MVAVAFEDGGIKKVLLPSLYTMRVMSALTIIVTVKPRLLLAAGSTVAVFSRK